MDSRRKFSRRSFMARVVGGGAALGGALGQAVTGARAQVTDGDPTDPYGRGRGGGTGVTDADTGPGSDPVGRGRGRASRPPQNNLSDSDNADPTGRGRGPQAQAQARACRALQDEIDVFREEIRQIGRDLPRMDATANFIESDYAVTPPERLEGRLRMYRARFDDLMSDGWTMYGDLNPPAMVAALRRVAARARQGITQRERQIEVSQRMMAENSCPTR
jgi:hypothetical protein